MFTFKKPKRNLRVREVNAEDSDNENETSNESSGVKPVKKSKKPIIQQPLLSFGEDLNEGDDGEVFKVKKSNQSKKIKKQLEKERKKKKDKTTEGQKSVEKQPASTINTDIIIKLKNTFPVLNGRDAEVAASISEDEEVESLHQTPTYIKQADSVKLLLKRGSIPDAAAIHAVRKQRQHLRELGEAGPVITQSNTSEKPEAGGGGSRRRRLVREEDEDEGSDDDEERMTMKVNTIVEDRLRRKAEFDAAQHSDSNESEKGEDDEWEAQQIRKGVTGAQIAAAQQETLYYQDYISQHQQSLPTQPQDYQPQHHQASAPYLVFPPLPSSYSLEPLQVIKKLKDRLSELNEVHRRHKLDAESASEEIKSLRLDCERIRGEEGKRREHFRYYQETRGYVTDLVDCLNEKVVIVDLLEKRGLDQISKRQKEYMSRRRQEVMDQSQEISQLSSTRKTGGGGSSGAGREPDEALVRRIAEREGRRIRRQRYRELRGIQGHMEGMSSDEEVTEAGAVAFRVAKGVIEEDGKHVFEDVVDEFGTVEGILRRFEGWRRTDMTAYAEAYVSLCLPKILAPFIRLKLLLWNPLIADVESVDFDKESWFKALLSYGITKSESEDSLRKDPDAFLIPRVMEQIIFQKLTEIVEECWDPVSSSQTVALIGLFTKLYQDYPLSRKSKSLTNFFKAVIGKLKDTVENDIYIPIYTPQRLTMETKTTSFFMRQCTLAIKVLGNATRWQGVLPDSVLGEIALASLLNRSLVTALRACSNLQAASLAQVIGTVLPRVWLQAPVPLPQLNHFLSLTKQIASGLDVEKPLERDALERLTSLLKAASSL